MSPAIQANVEGLWIQKQTARGTPAVAGATGRRLKKVGGDVTPGRTDGSENYSDGNRFTNATDFVDQIAGNGNPVVQCGPSDDSFLSYLMLGTESVGAAVATVLPHTITPSNTGSFWFSVWKKVGSSPVLRQRFNDCRMTSLRIEGSSANKVVKATPTFFSLDAGETFDTDPTTTVHAESPWLYTEAEGTFTLDTNIFRGHSSFALVINDNLGPWWGDSVYAHDVVTGQGTIVVEGITLLVDDNGLQQYNRIMYGNPTPPTATKPQKLVYMGSYEFELKRGVAATASFRGFKATLGKVHWTPDLSIPGNPDGGATELALAAEARTPVSGNQLVILANNLDIAYT